MSAYVVEDETINRVLRFMASEEPVSPSIDDNQAFGEKMHAMNVEAVTYRYPDKPDDLPGSTEQLNGFRFKLGYPPTKFQALMSLRCFLYQCNEGDIPDTNDLYHQLERYANALCCRIVEAMPEYEACKWG